MDVLGRGLVLDSANDATFVHGLRQQSIFRRGLASTTLHPLGLEVTKPVDLGFIWPDGTQLFDAIGSIGVSNFGHGNPTILQSAEATAG